jgi:hypothetical protein
MIYRSGWREGSSDFDIFLKFNILHVFWFGLEILRLVYKKAFFKNCTVSIFFNPPKKVALPLIRPLKKFLQNSPQRV